MSDDTSELARPTKLKSPPRRLKTDLTCLSCGPLVLDLNTMTLTKGGEIIKLTPKEGQLLIAFMRHPGQILPRELLIKEIWNTTYLDDIRMLHVHIRWLRKKIEDDPSHPTLIQTVRGRGYRFVPPDPEEQLQD